MPAAAGAVLCRSVRRRAAAGSHPAGRVQSRRTRAARSRGSSQGRSRIGTSRLRCSSTLRCAASRWLRSAQPSTRKSGVRTTTVNRLPMTAAANSASSTAPGWKSPSVTMRLSGMASAGNRKPCTHHSSRAAYTTKTSNRYSVRLPMKIPQGWRFCRSTAKAARQLGSSPKKSSPEDRRCGGLAPGVFQADWLSPSGHLGRAHSATHRTCIWQGRCRCEIQLPVGAALVEGVDSSVAAGVGCGVAADAALALVGGDEPGVGSGRGIGSGASGAVVGCGDGLGGSGVTGVTGGTLGAGVSSGRVPDVGCAGVGWVDVGCADAGEVDVGGADAGGADAGEVDVGWVGVGGVDAADGGGADAGREGGAPGVGDPLLGRSALGVSDWSTDRPDADAGVEAVGATGAGSAWAGASTGVDVGPSPGSELVSPGVPARVDAAAGGGSRIGAVPCRASITGTVPRRSMRSRLHRLAAREPVEAEVTGRAGPAPADEDAGRTMT
ncbi:hypothetical protein FAIPA1_180046 [Frankia sp. AiPs1]